MQLNIVGPEKEKEGNIALPAQFEEPFRPDLIQRAVLSLQANARQPYGNNPAAGKKAVITLTKRRRAYKGVYGKGMSRTPRKIMTRRGMQISFVGAFAPNTVGGRRAFPPVPEKDYSQKINDKERKKAIRSALAATITPEIVKARGHRIPDEYPFILSDKFENMKKTAEIKKALEKLGFEKELDRAGQTKIRAGKGKMRNRKYKNKKGPLIVTGKDCPLLKAAKNIEGVDVATANSLNAEMLAPGTHAGRLTLYTQNAIKTLKEAFK